MDDIPPLPGEAGQVSVEAARALNPQPTWNRHTPEIWAMIREEYQAGATAKQLAVKYRVSPTSIYRHAYQEGWSKKALARQVGDAALARAEAADVFDARALEGLGPNLPLGLAGEPAHPLEVRRLALAAVSRCLAAERYAEAERMGRLAECIDRLIPAQPVMYLRNEAAARRQDHEKFSQCTERIERRLEALEPIFEAQGISAAVIALIDDVILREDYRWAEG